MFVILLTICVSIDYFRHCALLLTFSSLLFVRYQRRYLHLRSTFVSFALIRSGISHSTQCYFSDVVVIVVVATHDDDDAEFSVTRLGDFWNFLPTNFVLKVGQMFVTFWAVVKTIAF